MWVNAPKEPNIINVGSKEIGDLVCNLVYCWKQQSNSRRTEDDPPDDYTIEDNVTSNEETEAQHPVHLDRNRHDIECNFFAESTSMVFVR